MHAEARSLMRYLFGCMAIALAANCADANAAVLEIQPDGSVITYDGPAVFDGRVVTPIAIPAAPEIAAPRIPQDLAPSFQRAAARTNLSPALLAAVASAESGFANSTSPKGAIGVMQLMPATAEHLGVDPHATPENVAGGALYLREMLQRFDGNLPLALAAYNAGPAAVSRYGGVPPFPETRAYVGRVLQRLASDAQEVRR